MLFYLGKNDISPTNAKASMEAPSPMKTKVGLIINSFNALGISLPLLNPSSFVT